MPSRKVTKSLFELYQSALSKALSKRVAANNIKLLLADITNTTIPSLFLAKDTFLNPEQEHCFEQYLERLFKHEPIQYILGKTEFYGLKLYVNEFALIPRPETEGLVEWITQQNKGSKSILDIGTGTGAIAIALKYLKPAFNLTATDISHEAIKLAKANARQLGCNVVFVKADLFPRQPAKYDIIVSNPPYIASSDYYALDDEVQLYEPRLALYAGHDGLALYRRILGKAEKYLQPEGKLYLEIGEEQAIAIKDIALSIGYKSVELRKDLAGKDRYLCISR